MYFMERGTRLSRTAKVDMTLTLNLPNELVQRLADEAQRQGRTVDEVAGSLLDKVLPPKDGAHNVIEMLQTWIDEGDADEQRETGEFLIQALDEDRLSERRFFPRELKDVTW